MDDLKLKLNKRKKKDRDHHDHVSQVQLGAEDYDDDGRSAMITSIQNTRRSLWNHRQRTVGRRKLEPVKEASSDSDDDRHVDSAIEIDVATDDKKDSSSSSHDDKNSTTSSGDDFNGNVTIFSTSGSNRLGECEGDCDDDEDCESGLYCYQREPYDPIPGCEGLGESDGSRTDYCTTDERAKSSKSSKAVSSAKASKSSKSSSSDEGGTSPTTSPSPTTSTYHPTSTAFSKASKSSSKSSKSSVDEEGESPTSSPSPTSSTKSSKSTSKSSKSSKATMAPNTPDDHYDDFCTKTNEGESVTCTSRSIDFGLNGDWITMDSTLTCPTRLVDKYGFVDTSQNYPTMCSCNATVTTYEWFLLDIIDTIEPIDGNCFACPVDTNLGIREGFGYSDLEMPVLEDAQCIGFDCEGRCNSTTQTILPPIPTDQPTVEPILEPLPTRAPTNTDDENNQTPPPTTTNRPPLTPTPPPTPPPTTDPNRNPVPTTPTTGPGGVVQSGNSGAFVLGASSSSWMMIGTTFVLYLLGNNRPTVRK